MWEGKCGISDEKAQKILKENGLIVSREQAAAIRDFLVKLAETVIRYEEEGSASLHPRQHR